MLHRDWGEGSETAGGVTHQQEMARQIPNLAYVRHEFHLDVFRLCIGVIQGGRGGGNETPKQHSPMPQRQGKGFSLIVFFPCS